MPPHIHKKHRHDLLIVNNIVDCCRKGNLSVQGFLSAHVSVPDWGYHLPTKEKPFFVTRDQGSCIDPETNPLQFRFPPMLGPQGDFPFPTNLDKITGHFCPRWMMTSVPDSKGRILDKKPNGGILVTPTERAPNRDPPKELIQIRAPTKRAGKKFFSSSTTHPNTFVTI
ncbi:hypothetical protein TNIN_2841 [Trichonephila inaurata madagascariensis]|uniref:Uncharacterized protein n=1 Tax=Trichonephila inaurata madagascariensis TaxID=2747483 RepID=A0A8X6Y8G8_9ARAC|nr:hypothetical protein TNIN_2841 [Trichonephila inaurata madagascariensis]